MQSCSADEVKLIAHSRWYPSGEQHVSAELAQVREHLERENCRVHTVQLAGKTVVGNLFI